MNIFYVDSDPFEAAKMLADRHVVKMILESAQLLSNGRRYYTGDDDRLYKPTHINHPCNIWVRESVANYSWLFDHFIGLLNEYTHRYGRVHKCAAMINVLKVPYESGLTTTPIRLCMPDEFKVNDAAQSYRNYYKYGKKHLHKWTNREPPGWIL